MSYFRNRMGHLGTCETPYCGAIDGYFCVKCRHYVTDCRCGLWTGGCDCEGENYGKWWAAEGERKETMARLAAMLDAEVADDRG